MECNKLRAELMEVVLSGPKSASSQLQEHLRSCAACTRELESFQKTMALMDEWQTPEPSPYFSTRLQARVREEAAVQPAGGWLAWLRRPVVAVAAAVLLTVGVGMVEVSNFRSDRSTMATNNESGVVRGSAPGTAVGDLQYLDKNAELFSDFDALDGPSSTE
jgi:anti-sigma factor RsiW